MCSSIGVRQMHNSKLRLASAREGTFLLFNCGQYCEEGTYLRCFVRVLFLTFCRASQSKFEKKGIEVLRCGWVDVVL